MPIHVSIANITISIIDYSGIIFILMTLRSLTVEDLMERENNNLFICLTRTRNVTCRTAIIKAHHNNYTWVFSCGDIINVIPNCCNTQIKYGCYDGVTVRYVDFTISAEQQRARYQGLYKKSALQSPRINFLFPMCLVILVRITVYGRLHCYFRQSKTLRSNLNLKRVPTDLAYV